MKKLLLATITTAVLAIAPYASATSITPYGEFGFTPNINGTTATYSSANGDLGSASSVTFSSMNNINTYIAPTYKGNTNIFYGVGTIAVGLPASMTVENLNSGSYTYATPISGFLTWTVGTDTYSFELDSVTWTSSATGALNLLALGTFSDSLGTYTSGLSELSIGFTATSEGDNYSGTYEVPPGFVPEPSSLVLLGTGLLGAAFLLFRLRRTTKSTNIG